MTRRDPAREPQGFISMRAAIVVMFAALTGVVVGALTMLAGRHPAEAALAALAAAAAGLKFFHWLIGPS